MSRRLSQITARRLITKLIDAVTLLSITAIISAWCAWIFINAMTGCGSSYITADGSQVAGVCVNLFKP